MKSILSLLASLALVGLAKPAPAAPPVRSAFDYVRAHGQVTFPTRPTTARPAPRAPDHLVGDTRSFWTWDLSVMPPRDVQVPATCRAVGDHSYVFVADDQWGSEVDQAAVDTVLAALETATPSGSIDPLQGIVPNEAAVFGAIPDALDGDPHVFVLLMELKSYNGTQFDGFFNAFNQYTDAEALAEAGYHSNEIEMITVNSTIRQVDTDTTLGILAHELQHLIHWGGDPEEVAWVGESCSEAAMVINGYLTDEDWLQDYLQAPETALYGDVQIHYGACLLFGAYLYERFGAPFLTALVADPAHGPAGFSGPLSTQDEVLSMDELLLDWATATIGDGLGATEPRFSHPLMEVGIPAIADRVSTYPTPSPLQGSLSDTGTAYLRLDKPTGQDVAVSLSADPAGSLLARLLLVDRDGVAFSADLIGQTAQIPFQQKEADAAYVILLARPGQTAGWSLSAEAVEPSQPDGGTDGGDADGGAEDGGEEDGGLEDGGADTSGPCPAGQEQVIYEDQPTCVPICPPKQHLTLEGSTWVCRGGGGSCGCGQNGASAPLALVLFGLVLLWSRRRRG